VRVALFLREGGLIRSEYSVVVAAFPALFLYFQNADEANLSEIAFPLLVFVATAVLIFIIFLPITKCAPKAAVIASLFMVVLLNYAFFEDLIQGLFLELYYWHILPIILFILAHIAWLICNKMRKELASTITLVIGLVFLGLMLFNGIIAAPVIINKQLTAREQQQKFGNADDTKDIIENPELPNIYLLIFDEYASIDFMKKYYNYDNSGISEYLEKLGFNISYTSHNESIMTSTVLTNLVNLDYIVDNTTSPAEKENYRNNNYLFKFLTEKGYTITGVGSTDYFGIENVAVDFTVSKTSTVSGETMTDLLFRQTAIWPFYTVSYNEDQERILNDFEYFKAMDNTRKNSCFTLCYFVFPHEPFYFDRYGRPYEQPTSNWKEKKYYLGQYIFATKKMREIAELLVENDPNSIIIIQSDHGARASSDPDLFLEIFPLEDVSNIFNAVYYKGEKLDIEGLSGVNTLRLVLNKAFTEQFDMLEVPVDTYKYK